MRSRSGFTLIELLVAIVLADIGLLALVGATAVIIRRHNETRLQATAARIAANRVERSIGAGCMSAGGINALPDNMNEVWSATTTGAVREIVDTVSYHAIEPR